MMVVKQHWLLAVFWAMTIGCSSVEKPMAKSKAINLNTTLFAFEPVVSEQELFSLTTVQRQKFLSFYQLETSKGYLPHEVIERFLQNNLSNFTYYGKTYIASKAMLNNSGNCMSLAILTTAFSRLVGVEMAYRKMHSLPMYEKHGNVILSSSHVQSLLYDPSFIPEENYFYIHRPAILIDYFPQEGNIRSKTVNTTRFLAMYYINKAAEYYIESDLNKAFAYANQAYQLDNESASAMNLLALLHKRKGDEVTAEHLYMAAIASSDVNISVLDNYVNLLKQQGRTGKVQQIKQQIENIYDPNPYHWLEKAQLARSQNELNESEKFYRKAIKLAPYVKQAYIELHEVYLLQDKKSLAISTLRESLPWLHEPKQKRQYKKKLYQLSAAI